MRSFIPVLLLSGLLAGCASLTEDECHSGNWQSIGLNDAIQGRTSARLNDHIKACQRYGVLPDKGLYDQGYRQGLVRYCSPTNGFTVGRNGYAYHSICPAGSEASFLRGYERGHDLHAIEKQIAEARSSLNTVRNKIRDLRQEKPHPRTKGKENGQGARKEQERERRASIRRLTRDADRLEDEIDRLNYQRDRALLEADRFLASVSPDI